MDGVIILNKPKGYTSRDAVNHVSKILQVKKIGHTGTLDPLATGVLVLCLGQATKLSSYFTDFDKCYRGEVILGLKTETLDLEGKVIAEQVVPSLKEETVKAILTQFLGEIEQEVPLYSAVKVKGRRLYQYARRGEEVVLPRRQVFIKRIELVSPLVMEDGKVKFMIECCVTKGTYIRSLVKDIGESLGTIATMGSLVRLKQGPYTLAASCTLADLQSNNFRLISIKEALSFLPQVKVPADLARQIKNGAVVNRFFTFKRAVILDQQGEVMAIYRTDVKDVNRVRPDCMLIKGNKT